MGSLWLLWLGYGLVGGIGNGLGFITPIAVLVRWYPDKQALVTGLAVMGFGLGAAVTGLIVPYILPGLGIAGTFFVLGIIFLIVLLLAAQKLDNPPEFWVPTGFGKQGGDEPVLACDLPTAVSMYQFYLLWAILFLNVVAGIAIISNLSPMAQAQAGLSAVAAGTVVFLGGLANGFGRLIWAALSNRIGRHDTFLLILGTQIPLFIVLPQVHNPVVFTAICCYILLCYGGGFGTMPAFATDCFGTACMGQIYGKILLAWGFAGALGPMLMEYAKTTTGGFSGAEQTAAILLALGFLLTALCRKPAKLPVKQPEGA
jgi:OFA family oxalate/formate antiporter-like MFS transporter